MASRSPVLRAVLSLVAVISTASVGWAQGSAAAIASDVVIEPQGGSRYALSLRQGAAPAEEEEGTTPPSPTGAPDPTEFADEAGEPVSAAAIVGGVVALVIITAGVLLMLRRRSCHRRSHRSGGSASAGP